MDFMTLASIAVSIAVPAIGGLVAYGMLRQKVKDLGEEIDELKHGVNKAMDAATQVNGLAQAVEHMGQRFADQIKHLVETSSLSNAHIYQQLADIKEQQRRSPPRRRASDEG